MSAKPVDYNTAVSNLVGMKFGKLTVLSFAGFNNNICGKNYDKALVNVLCECGNTKQILLKSLKSGNSKSCGCMTKLGAKNYMTKHGFAHTKEYHIWGEIIMRCYNKINKAYPRYGGRGILMEERWRNSFIEFINDLGWRPSEHHSIERINNDKGYFKDNCKWATITEQSRNKRNTKYITLNGEIKSLPEWCEQLGLKYKTVVGRLNRGKSIESAFKI